MGSPVSVVVAEIVMQNIEELNHCSSVCALLAALHFPIETTSLLLTSSTTASTTNSCTEQLWAHQFPLMLQKLLCKTSRNKPLQLTNEHCHSGYVTLTIPLQPYTKMKSTIFMNTSTDKTLAYSLLRRSRKMVKYLF